MTIASLHVLSSSLWRNFCTINRDKYLYPKLYILVSIFHHEALMAFCLTLKCSPIICRFNPVSDYVHLPSAIRGQSKNLDLTHHLCLAPAGTHGNRSRQLRAKATLVSANYSNKQTNKQTSSLLCLLGNKDT